MNIGTVEAAPAANPGVLSPGKYGDPVTLSWPAAPLAYGYYVQIGHWPWGVVETPVIPSNCLGGFCFDGPAAGSTLSGNPPPDSQLVPGATSVTIPGDSAGKGRYCWMVWPVLENPAKTSEPNVEQPFVDPNPFNVQCYTTEAATPRITVDNPPSGSGFSSAPITGTITFDYVSGTSSANRSFEISGSKNGAQTSVSGTVTPNANCTPTTTNSRETWLAGNDFLFPDVYGCAYTFSFTPEKSTTYTITASATGYATTVTPDPVSFTTGSCGGDQESCCDSSTGPACDGADHICANGSCVACGAAGKLCCANNSCGAGAVCDGTNCIPCGGTGQPCCAGPICNQGAFCGPSTNACEAVAACDQRVISGTSTKVETVFHEVNVGANDGMVIFYFDSLTVPDNFILWSGGIDEPRTNKLFESSCFGTRNVDLAPPQPCNGTICCNDVYAGSCSYTIDAGNYNPPASGKLTVQVDQNCAGTSDTGWSFMVTCPQ